MCIRDRLRYGRFAGQYQHLCAGSIEQGGKEYAGKDGGFGQLQAEYVGEGEDLQEVQELL